MIFYNNPFSLVDVYIPNIVTFLMNGIIDIIFEVSLMVIVWVVCERVVNDDQMKPQTKAFTFAKKCWAVLYGLIQMIMLMVSEIKVYENPTYHFKWRRIRYLLLPFVITLRKKFHLSYFNLF